MEDIQYLDEKTAANNKQDMLVFDLNTPRFAEFLVAFSNVLHSSYTDTATDKDVIAREVVGSSCYSQRLRCNFNLKYICNTKKYEFRSIYRNFDGKLVIYVPSSNYNGIQYNRSNDDSVKLIAKYIKQFSYNKFVYEKLIDFTNKSIAEINAMFDEMRSQNNGKLISNDYNYTVFSKKLKIKNAILEFVVGHESESNLYRKPYQYFQLIVKYNDDKDKKKDFTIRYNPDKKRYSQYLSQILDTLKFDDEFNNEFKNEWSSENTKPSVFSGFTIGEVKDIYDLMAYNNNNNVTKNMSKYIDCRYGLSPVELEIYKQFKNELYESVNKAINELDNAYANLAKIIRDTKAKANEELTTLNNKAIEEYKNNVNKYNAILSESGCNLQLSKEIPDELLSHTAYFT